MGGRTAFRTPSKTIRIILSFLPPKNDKKKTVGRYGNALHIKPEEEPERQLLGAVSQVFKIKLI